MSGCILQSSFYSDGNVSLILPEQDENANNKDQLNELSDIDKEETYEELTLKACF